MNKIVLMGRLTRNPEIRATEKIIVARFSIAVDRKFKRDNEPDTDFFNCVAFGKTAEFMEKYLSQGRRILVVGRAEIDSYTNKDGAEVKALQIKADEVEFADSKNSGAKPVTTDDGFMNVPDEIDEELPFN